MSNVDKIKLDCWQIRFSPDTRFDKAEVFDGVFVSNTLSQKEKADAMISQIRREVYKHYKIDK